MDVDGFRCQRHFSHREDVNKSPHVPVPSSPRFSRAVAVIATALVLATTRRVPRPAPELRPTTSIQGVIPANHPTQAYNSKSARR